MNFEPNNVSSCVLSMPSVYVVMKSADDQRLSSLPNSCYQKDTLARNDGNSSSFIERKSERVDRASGHDDDGDEADGDGPHDIMECSSGCYMLDHGGPNQPSSGQILLQTRLFWSNRAVFWACGEKIRYLGHMA